MLQRAKVLLSSVALMLSSGLITQSVQAEEYDPALWKVEHKGKTSYLFGSIHMGDDSMYPLPKKVMDAYNSSEFLAVEANINDLNPLSMAGLVQELAMDMKNPITDSLSEETKVAYAEYCKEPIMPCQQVNMFEPWFASLTIQALAAQKAGYDDQSGIDMFFLKDADDNDKKIIELEGVEYQLRLLDGMSAKSQDIMFLSSIQMEMSDTAKLMTAWKSGDLEGFLEASEAEMGDLTEQQIKDYEQFNNEFNADRNTLMAEKIDGFMQEGKTLFVVVGALHYTGEEGVHSLLKKKGYKVTRM